VTTPLPRRSRTLVVGILNVTPDSFSDGGRWSSPQEAIERGRWLARHGADILDVGGESTRPGADRIGADEELARVLPVIDRLTRDGAFPPVSIDTRRSGVAQAAVQAGAMIVNDVSGGLADPGMLPFVADAGVDFVCQRCAPGDAVVSAGTEAPARLDATPGRARDNLIARRDACLAAGIAPDRLILDPGLGFATAPEVDWALLQTLQDLVGLGHRLLVGPSRKRFLAAAGIGDDLAARDAATAAVSAWCAWHGVWAVRVHDVVSGAAAVRVATRLSATDPTHPGGAVL